VQLLRASPGPLVYARGIAELMAHLEPLSAPAALELTSRIVDSGVRAEAVSALADVPSIATSALHAQLSATRRRGSASRTSCTNCSRCCQPSRASAAAGTARGRNGSSVGRLPRRGSDGGGLSPAGHRSRDGRRRRRVAVSAAASGRLAPSKRRARRAQVQILCPRPHESPGNPGISSPLGGPDSGHVQMPTEPRESAAGSCSSSRARRPRSELKYSMLKRSVRRGRLGTARTAA
jgi:hypothetical protein